jgi:hypothetical protein
MGLMSRLLAILFSGLSFSAAQADPVRLSELSRQDEVNMQRGTPYPNLVCVQTVIQEVIGYGGPEAASEFFVEFENAPVSVFSEVAGITHTCVDGVHTMWSNHVDGPQVLQIYNMDGQPTMMTD